MTSALPPDAKKVLGYAENVSTTLQAGGLFAFTAVAARILGHDEIPIPLLKDFKVPLTYTVAIFFAGTIVHIFWTRFIIQGLNKIADDDFKDPSHHSIAMLFDEISNSKKRFLNGLVARSKPIRKHSRIAEMSLSDPTTYLSYGLAVLTILAILPWRVDNGLRWSGSWWTVLAYATMALILVVINWWIGGLWIITLSLMKDEPKVRRDLETDSLHPEWWDEPPASSGLPVPKFSTMGKFIQREAAAIFGLVVVAGIGLVLTLVH